MASIQDLPVKILVKVLAKLRGGEIGFDPYRDERTNKKDRLLAFIVKNHSTPDIVAAIDSVNSEAFTAAAANAADAFLAETFASESTTLNAETLAAAKKAMEQAERPVEERYAHGAVVDHPLTDTAPYVLEYIDMNEKHHTVGFEYESSCDSFLKTYPMHRYVARHSPARFKNGKTATTKKQETTIHGTPITTVSQDPRNSPTPHVHTDARMAALQALLTPVVDESKVKAICDAQAQTYVDNILEAVNSRLGGYDAKIEALQFPTTVQILPHTDAKPIDLGLQHKNFPVLLKMSQARMRDGHKLNIWLKGPAGSGKTTAAAKVAEALTLDFHFNGAISTEYELMGFKDASGTYHRTAFREAFENGGVYLFDEIDSSLPKAVLAFNAALANGKCQFPDRQVRRHPDCLVIAGANTAGNGATSDYVGRMKQDLAFLNRFVLLDWPLDEALEKALASNKDWCRKVQRFRKNADSRKIKGHIISPRATFYGEALLAAGIDEEMVEHAVLRGALSDEQWSTLCQ